MTHLCIFCPLSHVALQQPCEDVLIIPTLQVRRLRLREFKCELSTALSLYLQEWDWNLRLPDPKCVLGTSKVGDNSEVNAPCPVTLQAPLGHGCFSPSTLSPHSRNAQPELITVAGACEMALTPQERPEGPACGYLQKPEPQAGCSRSSSSCKMSCTRALTSSCQHQRSSLRS